jgi:hypothetical protein
MKIEEKIHLNKFKPRHYQLPIADALENKGYKKIICVMPRRAGKDVLCWNLIIRQAFKRVGVYFYMFPTYSQAKKVIWSSSTNDGQRFIDFIPSSLVESSNSQDMSIRLTNGSLLQLIGSDNIDSVVGTNPIGVVYSEAALQDPRAYQFIRPILAANDGFAIFISTPRGKNWFYDLFQIATHSDDWFAYKLTLEDTEHIPLHEIEKERAEGIMSEDLIQQEYYCFPPGHLVMTPNGKKEIESLSINDLVLTHKNVFKEVNKTYVSYYEGDLIEFVSNYYGHIITCTPNHLLYIWRDESGGMVWERAFNVTLDDLFSMPATNFLISPHKINSRSYKGDVYNIGVSEDESYSVMHPDSLMISGVAVHNCSWDMGVEGSYYSRYIDRMRVQNRIGDVPWESSFKVHTAWDLGMRDSTTITFFQTIGTTVRVIDCYENSGFGLDHYIKVLQQKPYAYGKHIAPHDIKVRELGTGQSRLEKARTMGLSFTVAPDLSIEDGIEAVRAAMSKIWMDETKCSTLIKALENYRHEYDEKKKSYKGIPLHNWASHFADCFRYMCISLPKTRDGASPEDIDRNYREAMGGGQSHLPSVFRTDLPDY